MNVVRSEWGLQMRIVLVALLFVSCVSVPVRVEPAATCRHAARQEACVAANAECYLMRNHPRERRIEFLRCDCPCPAGR
jgi:hypothetical protein